MAYDEMLALLGLALDFVRGLPPKVTAYSRIPELPLAALVV
jgi:hypothetical protein